MGSTNRISDAELRELSDKLRDIDHGLSPIQRGLLRQAMSRAAGQEVEGYFFNPTTQGIIIIGGGQEFDYYASLTALYNDQYATSS
jgi:hypothetical protein